MLPDVRARLILLLIGVVVLTLAAMLVLWALAWARRRGSRRLRHRVTRRLRRGGRRTMPDLWQAGGDRLAQQLTQKFFREAGGANDEDITDLDDPGRARKDQRFDEAENPEDDEDEDGESWKHGVPYEPRFDPPSPTQSDRDDAHGRHDDDDEDDDDDGDVPAPPHPRR